MADKIAEPSFVSGPDDNVAVVDVYKESTPKNATVSTNAKVVATTAAENIRKKDGLAKDIAESFSLKGGKVTVDKKEGLERLASASGDISSPVGDLKESLKDKALDLLGIKDKKPGQDGGLPGDLNKSGKKLLTKKNVKIVINDVERLMDGADLSSAQGVAALLGGLAQTESIKIFDLEAQFAVVKTILDEAARLGIPEALDIILAKIEDEKERKKQLLRNLRNAFMMTDYKVINEAITLVKAAGVMARVPNGITLFAMFYRKPRDLKNAGFAAERTKIKNLFNALDNKWAVYNRNGVEITNFEVFAYMSDDFYEVMVNDATYRDTVMIARNYRSRNLRDLAITSFPKTTFPYQVNY